MAAYQCILLEKDPQGHLGTVTLNRPDRRNALNDVMQDEIGDAMKMAAAAETITLTSQDHAEGTAAFRESRRPIYGGR